MTGPNADAFHAPFTRVIDALHEKLPAIAEHLEAARADTLAFTASPKGSWRIAASLNAQPRPALDVRTPSTSAGGGPIKPAAAA